MDSLFSDFDSLSESSSSEDQDDLEFPYNGCAFSILSSLEESLGKIDDFLSFERGFVPGDVVSSIKDPSGQMGKVIDVDILVDLENIQGRKVQNVNSKILKKVRSISVGDFVVNGAWLGKVEKIVDRVTVLFDDGTRSEFSASSLENLIPTSPDLIEDSQYPFYPGLRVQLTSSSVYKPPRWLCGMKKDIKNQGTVCSVNAGLVYVDWLSCASINCEKAPAYCQDSENLTMLSCFSHANWQLGDWCLIPVINSKSFRGQKFLGAPACELVEEEQEQLKRDLQRGSFNLNCQEIAVITKMKTTVDVVWQDGSYSIGLDSRSLLPVSIIDAHDFWAGQFVLEKGICDDSTVPSIQRWGIVKCVDSKERTLKVKWCSVALDQPNSVKLHETEEVVSAYELTEHPNYSYCLGDAIFRHQSHCTKQSDENINDNHRSKVFSGSKSDLKYTDNCEDIKGEFNRNFLSCIGIVVGLKDGAIEVTWASGAKDKVLPHEIYKVEKIEVSSNVDVNFSENSEQSGEGATVPDNQFLEQREKDELGFQCCNQDEDSKKLWGSSSSSFPHAAMGILKSIGSSLFFSMSTSLYGTYKNLSENEKNQAEVVELCSISTDDAPDPNYLEMSVETNSLQKLIKCEEGKDHTPTLNKYPEYFRQFDMVSDCADNHFVDGAGMGPQFSQIKRGWVKRIQKEWTILEKDLPDTIYVRVYEERMDLLRAAVVGAPGTPYHDNLFFFDIFMSPEYPHEPPTVHYNSGGLRVNPNLYESGKVCLSLLNTWTGSGSEVWNPENSTILQVLLSLQALVLNEKPYFNEAGYDFQIGKAEGEKNSICYNENAFLMSCKSMLYLLRKPPKHFEELVEEHFSKRCKHILLSCKAYMEGAPVGSSSAFVNEKDDQAPNKNGSSTGFKIMLAKLYPKLVEAFEDKGMDCSDLSLDQSE